MKRGTIITLTALLITANLIFIHGNADIFGHDPEEIAGFYWNGNVGEIRYPYTENQNGHLPAEIENFVWVENDSEKIGLFAQVGDYSMIRYTENFKDGDSLEYSSRYTSQIEVDSYKKIRYLLKYEDLLDPTNDRTIYTGNLEDLEEMKKMITISSENKKIGIIVESFKPDQLLEISQGAYLKITYCSFQSVSDTDWDRCKSQETYYVQEFKNGWKNENE